ncbi:hypothetical protein PILCRDRAFT_15437 [Piloderma croceum F 1598]|uniref:Uncharacterized protein n=1 Tax=Piloderma croceum (strain F 1598) TaxID=765440 RepID=A0A0C3EKS3_PILCF|nr:hypothetical protein PILCRDRAFT_15437 [Piloderma croceum F 1598]
MDTLDQYSIIDEPDNLYENPSPPISREPVRTDFERLCEFSPKSEPDEYGWAEAEYTLALIHTERDMRQIQKRAADLRLKASCLRAQLYRLQAGRAAKELAAAELRVGRVNSSITRSGRQRYPSVRNALDLYGDRRTRYRGNLSVRLD